MLKGRNIACIQILSFYLYAQNLIFIDVAQGKMESPVYLEDKGAP